MEDLSDVSFLSKLLVLPSNVRLDWKVFARSKHSSLFGLISINKEKKFDNIDSWRQGYKTFFFTTDAQGKQARMFGLSETSKPRLIQSSTSP